MFDTNVEDEIMPIVATLLILLLFYSNVVGDLLIVQMVTPVSSVMALLQLLTPFLNITLV